MANVNVKVFLEDWCHTCQKVKPDLVRLENVYRNLVDWENLSVDTHGPQLGVSLVPTIIILKNGVEVDRMIGERPHIVYEDSIKKYL
jgi:thiol-disulfide isomerase/thioredoxin